MAESFAAGRLGRARSSPPQFGHFPSFSAQLAQKVHSKEQMRASVDSGGRSFPQHSQQGLSSSMSFVPVFLLQSYSPGVSIPTVSFVWMIRSEALRIASAFDRTRVPE